MSLLPLADSAGADRDTDDLEESHDFRDTLDNKDAVDAVISLLESSITVTPPFRLWLVANSFLKFFSFNRGSLELLRLGAIDVVDDSDCRNWYEFTRSRTGCLGLDADSANFLRLDRDWESAECSLSLFNDTDFDRSLDPLPGRVRLRSSYHAERTQYFEYVARCSGKVQSG